MLNVSLIYSCLIFSGLTNGRAPLDVVLSAGYLGSGQDSIAHLLLPVRTLIYSKINCSSVVSSFIKDYILNLSFQDDLATSSDLYSSEDGILSMDTSFAPSTINLRDLE